MVYCATMQNTVYAFDADDPSASTPLWSTNLGTAVTNIPTQLVQPSWGILSTPVIDTVSGTLYAVARIVGPGSTPQITLNALDIHTGSSVKTPTVIQASVSGSTSAPDRDGSGNIVMDGSTASQRVALLLANGSIYIGLISNFYPPYHGWLLRYDTGTLQQAGAFITTLNGASGGDLAPG